MSTDVNVKTLKINQLTEAQYNAAIQGGIIGANELSFITDTNYVETLPSQTGHNGAYLTTNGTDLSWGNLANVAVSGDYNDLINTPTIPPSITVDQTYNAVSTNAQAGLAVAEAITALTNNLANIAYTAEYSDLLNTPTIPNVPVVVQDFYVNGTTGAIDCTFSATPTTKTVHTIIGNTVINGTWSGNTFTPNTASDILNNANGFIVSVF